MAGVGGRWGGVAGAVALVVAGAPGCIAAPREDVVWGRMADASDDARYAYAKARTEAVERVHWGLIVPGLVGSVVALVGSYGMSDDTGDHLYGWMTLGGFAVSTPCLLRMSQNMQVRRLWWLEAGRLGPIDTWPGDPQPWRERAPEPERVPPPAEGR